MQVILDTADNNDTRITALEAVSRSNVTNNAPTSDDDINDGYSVGFLWVDTSQNQPYILLDNASGAAVWKPLAFNYFVGQAGLLALR